MFSVKNPSSQASCERPTTGELVAYATTFGPIPAEVTDLLPLVGGPAALTFASGTPFNDVEFTTFDTDYIEGETSGYDTFMPANPADEYPGAGTVKIVRAVSHPWIDRAYGGAPGDRIILGLPENPKPFFRRPGDGVDDDFAVIQNFDFVNGHVQLAGSPADYAVVRAGAAEGAASDGWYLVYTADWALDGVLDLIAFIHPCDDVRMRPLGGAPPPSAATLLCNSSQTLDLADPAQFRFVTPGMPAPAAFAGITQTGSAGHEIVGGIATDSAGNVYLFGATDGKLDGGADPDNELFVSKHRPDGSRVWVTEIGTLNGGLLFDAVTDSTHLYAVGRTFGALPGFTNAGVWDGIILKLRLDDGAVIDIDQWGNSGIDGYGAVTLDDAGNLYVSGAGSSPGASVETGDNEFLVAKHSAATLDNVWRVLEPVLPTSTNVAEAWSGVTYVPGATPGAGRLVAGGWFAAPPNGAEGFLALYGQLDSATPTRIETATIGGQTQRADWILDNDADAAGNIYAVGYTTGSLAGPQAGQGDAFIVKFDPDLRNPVYRQLGTPRSDQFRKVVVDPGGTIYAVGYTYGDWVGANADPGRGTGDIVVLAFDTNLNPVASTQFGTPGEERGYLARQGTRLYVGGMTEGSLAGPHLGAFDAFAIALDPATLAVLPP